MTKEQVVAVDNERLAHMVNTLERDSSELEFDQDVLVCLKELQLMREIIGRGGNVWTMHESLRTIVARAG